MLRALAIRDFAIVDQLEVELQPGFNVLTGETGAGKSILVDALSLLLGERSEPSLIRAGAARAELSAEFSVTRLNELQTWLLENDFVANDDTLLLRRILESNGRSRAYLNGTPVTLAQLKTIAEHLVDIHGQHAHQSLVKVEQQRRLLDCFGGFNSLANAVHEAWRAWQRLRTQRQRSEQADALNAAEREHLQTSVDELSALNFSLTEWPQLLAEQAKLAHAAQLLETVQACLTELQDHDQALLRRLHHHIQALQQVSEYDSTLQETLLLLEPTRIQLQEATYSLRQYLTRLEIDPQRLTQVEQRIADIHATARKYKTKPELLPEFYSTCQAKLAELSLTLDQRALAAEEEKRLAEYRELSRQLTAKRTMAAGELSEQVSKAMQQLAMEGGEFSVELTPLSESSAHGLENIEFAVSTHRQQALLALAKVASGGELSRLSLAIQVVTSEVARVPTLIFDEVDVGIGGGVAEVVGRLLRKLGRSRQVLCVTHLPQVAACADWHWQVSKLSAADRVYSELRALNAKDRIEELARMLGGVNITAKTRAHAKELWEESQRPVVKRD